MKHSVEYDALGRMKYNPDLHPRHKRPWLCTEEKYLIENYVTMGPEATAAALGRTIGVIMRRVCNLRKIGKMPERRLGTPKHRRIRPIRL